MAKKSEKKKDPAQQEWKRPSDIKVWRTSDPKVMLNKYLAEAVKKKWTEDFIDEDTGNIVSIERSEVLHNRGKYLDKDAVSNIMFNIQAEEIKDVAVTDVKYDLERLLSNVISPWEVTTCDVVGKKRNYLVRAQSVEKSIQVALDYAGMYLFLSGWVTVSQVKNCNYRVIEDSDECIPENAPDNPDSDCEYYKVTVQSRFFCDLDDDIEKSDHVFIIKAQDVGEAKERITDYCKKLWAETLKYPRNSFVVLKGQPYVTDGIVPQTYCQLYYERQEY